MTRRVWAAALVLAVLLAGCINVSGGMASPTCADGDAETVVLMAQSVPDAALVPCIDALPAGWEVMELDITSAGSSMRIADDQAGLMNFLQVRFVDDCDVSGAVELRSDEPSTRRYEQIEDITGGFVGTRTYVFEGGCVTYHFELAGAGWSATVNDATSALTFVTRDALAEAVEARTGGAVDRL